MQLFLVILTVLSSDCEAQSGNAVTQSSPKVSGNKAPVGENRDLYDQWCWISLSDPHSQAEFLQPVSTLILLCKTLEKQSKSNLYKYFLFPLLCRRELHFKRGK